MYIMKKNRVIYNSQAVYIGPSPASGYHFINDVGELNNQTNFAANNYNLIKRINGITNFDYNITLPREEFKQLGKSKIADNTIINNPTVEVNFEYYLNGITNEARMGFNVNHEFLDSLRSGQLAYPNNFSNFIFSGLNTFDTNEPTSESPFWPGDNRSNKNIFLNLTYGPNEDEVTNYITGAYGGLKQSNVICFGDGYMSSYDTSCAVGETPKAKVGFTCDNVVFYTGNSGLGIPSISPKTRENFDNIKFVLPNESVIHDISIILPGDISIDIQQTGDATSVSMNNITGFGVQFNDIKIQNYSIGIKFDRENMNSIGYKAPASRRINFPVPINFSLSTIVGDESTANLVDQIQKDDKYNITLKMKDVDTRKDLIRYDFKKAALQSYDYSSSIQQERRLNMTFKINATPDDLTEAFFVSGKLTNLQETANVLTIDDGSILVTEDSLDSFILNLVPIY